MSILTAALWGPDVSSDVAAAPSHDTVQLSTHSTLDVDLSIEAGLAFAATLGYSAPADELVVRFVLGAYARGYTQESLRTWLSFNPGTQSQWVAITSHSLAGSPSAQPRRPAH